MKTHKRLKITVTVLKYLHGGKIQTTNKRLKRTAILIGQHKTCTNFWAKPLLTKFARVLCCAIKIGVLFWHFVCWDLHRFRTLAESTLFS